MCSRLILQWVTVACVPLLVSSGGAPVAAGEGSCPSLGYHELHSSPFGEAEVLTVTLIGTFGFIGLLFYMVNSTAGHFFVRHSTWNLIEQMVSIFLAVLSFVAIEIQMHEAHLHFKLQFLISLATLVVFCIITFGLAFARSHEVSDLMTIMHLGEHILGFAGYFFIGHLQEAYGAQNVWLWISCWAVGTLIHALVLCVFGMLIIPRIAIMIKGDPEIEDNEEYEEELYEAIPKGIGFASAGNFIRCIMMLISGCPPALKHAIGKHPLEQRLILLACAIFLGVFSVSVHVFRHTSPKQKKSEESEEHEEHEEHELTWTKLFWTTDKAFYRMSFAWCAIFYGRWELYESQFHDALLGRIVFAISVSFIGLWLVWVFLFVHDCCHHEHHTFEKDRVYHVSKEISKVMGFVIGFAWEQTFDVAFETTASVAAWLRWIGVAFIAGFTLPGFYWYVMPKVIVDEKRLARYQQEVKEEVIYFERRLGVTILPSEDEAMSDEEEGPL